MGTTFYFDFEPALMIWLQSHMGTAAQAAASFFTLLGNETFMIAVLGFLYWCYDKEFGKKVGTALLAGLVFNALVKCLVMRRRPYMDHTEIRCLKKVTSGADLNDIKEQGYSFPSMHSTNSAVLYGMLPEGFAKTRAAGVLRVLAVLLPFLIGLSRVLVGVHYPTDVLCGWLVGIGILLITRKLDGRIRGKWKLRLVMFLASCVGILFCRTSDYYTSLGIMGGLFLGFELEERKVHFKETRSLLRGILRIAGGIGLYFALNTVFKLPFPKEFLTSDALPALLVRTVRYLIVTFLIIGVYPMLFVKLAPKFDKNIT
ncbi:MAG: phosphatase PAP2 family protein [Lachnospiraceae bacterium]|nr:phosphatase PAP2 family protein [Lachnospiraceae bacterium]